MPYKFIYFDLDDTLLDHRSAEAAALNDVHKQFTLFNGTSSEQLVRKYHDVNREQWELYSKGKVTRDQLQRNRFEQTLQHLELDESQYEEVGNYYMQCYQNHWQWIEGARESYCSVLDHFPVGILTNGFAETPRKKFSKFNLYDSADHIVISEDVGVLKPDPKVFQHATELAGVAPNEILYVGDSYTSDIKGGSQFGWSTAWFTTEKDPQKHAAADFVFDEFRALNEFLKQHLN